MEDGSLIIIAILILMVWIPLYFLGSRWLDKKEKR